MSRISDDELVLYHYRDGLTPARIAEIDDALFVDGDLRRRMNALLRTLNEVDALVPPEADAGLESRVWDAIAPRLSTTTRETPLEDASRWRAWWRHAWAPRPLALAAVLLLAALGWRYGSQGPAPMPDGPPIATTAGDPRGGERLRSWYVAEHLRTTERVLQTSANVADGSALQPDRARIADLLAQNRIYQQAAERSGDQRTAALLRRVEPVLIDLANRTESGAIQEQDGWRAHLAQSDLLFQMRVTSSALERDGARQRRPT
jgi:hypothetical protein